MRKLGATTIALSLIVALLIGLTSCGARSIRAPAEDLLIDDLFLFPAGWTIKSPPFSARDNLHVLMDQGAIDFADVGFASPDGHLDFLGANQVIWNFGSSVEAVWEFRRRFRPPDPSFSIEQLGGAAYHSKVADRFRLYCTLQEMTLQIKGEQRWTGCTAIGQYGEYISEFNAVVGNEYNMSPADFERILRAIDEKISASLDSHTP